MTKWERIKMIYETVLELVRDVTPVYKIVMPAIITDEKLPDMEELSARMGVKLFLA